MRFIYFTDIHLQQGRDSVAGFERALETMLAAEPELLICGGDLGVSEECRLLYTERTRALPVPCRTCFGNHELDNGAYNAQTPPGSVSFSWDAGGAHFIVLDVMRHTPAHMRRSPNWWGEVNAAQLEWLAADLAATPAAKPVVLVTHMPLRSSAVFRLCGGEVPAAYPHNAVGHAEEVLRLLQNRAAVACLAGHFHENERSFCGNAQLLTTGAVAGNWWRNGWDSPNIDGAPQGFRIVDVADGQITSRYRAFLPEQQREAAVFRRGEEAFVNVFDGSARTRVELDGAGVLPFIAPEAAPYDRRPAHLWAIPRSFDHASVRASVCVQITFEDGYTVQEELPFAAP